MARTELNLRERRAIENMLYAKMPVSKIAVAIGRHRSIVYREIKRNHFQDDELPYLSGYEARSGVQTRAAAETDPPGRLACPCD